MLYRQIVGPSNFLQSINWRFLVVLACCIFMVHFIIFQPSHRPPINLAVSSDSTPITLFGHSIPLQTDDTLTQSDIVSSEENYEQSSLFTSPNPQTDRNAWIPTPESEYIAICLSVKDQVPDLPEWLIHHYHHLSIRRFYIMDDGSDPPLSTIEPEAFGIPYEVLTFIYQERSTRVANMQTAFYSRCLSEFGSRHEWIAFIDVDEFLDTPPPTEIHSLLYNLAQNESVGALAVNWRMHTSSALLTRPLSTRKAFTTCIWDDPENNNINTYNAGVKSIVRPQHAIKPMNPHMFLLAPGILTVGESGDVVMHESDRRPVTRGIISLHHYAVKSREEYEEKMSRSNGMSDAKGEGFWDMVESGFPHVECREMVGYEP